MQGFGVYYFTKFQSMPSEYISKLATHESAKFNIYLRNKFES